MAVDWAANSGGHERRRINPPARFIADQPGDRLIMAIEPEGEVPLPGLPLHAPGIDLGGGRQRVQRPLEAVVGLAVEMRASASTSSPSENPTSTQPARP